MSKDLPDFLGGEPTPEPDAQAAPEPSPPEAPAAEVTPEAAPTAPLPGDEPLDPTNPLPPTPEPAPVAPLAALLDEREKRQAAERRANELEQWRQQQEAKAQQAPVPDRFDDPDAFDAYRDRQLASFMQQQTLNFSRKGAEILHGRETVSAAFEWGAKRCDQDPYFNQKVAASNDPYEVVISEWKREQLLSRIDPNDIDAFQQWKAGQPAPQASAPRSAAPALQPPVRPQAPRASLAAAPSASSSGSPLPLDGEATFERMFGPK